MRLPVAHVGERVGYENEAAFGRAFKRWTGRTPGDLRRGAVARPTVSRPLVA